MTDIIDKAQEFEALNLAQSLQAQAAIARATRRPAAQGHCLNRDCEEPFEANSPRLYCGPACAERHDKQLKLDRH